MKKFVAGAFFGFILATAVSVNAAEIVSIVGKKVEGSFPVTVNGEQLTTQAAVIDGTSYLPVRAIGEALDKNVGFDATTGVTLNDKEVATVTVIPGQPVRDIEGMIKYLKSRIYTCDVAIDAYQKAVDEDPGNEEAQRILKINIEKKASLEQQLAELEQQNP